MDSQENEMRKGIRQSRESKPLTKIRNGMKLIFMLLFIILISVAGIYVKSRFLDRQESKEEILSVSTLEKMIKVSELSTFEAVYNGIAKVMNEEKPERVDYYVSYEAKVYAGFDINEVKIIKEDDTKKFIVTIPKLEITNIEVDIASLDYIFQNKRANTSTVSEQAYKACIADVTEESEKEAAIYDFAEQNAKNIMKALVSPFIEQIDPDYESEIKVQGDE